MADVELKIIQRDIQTRSDALIFGAAEALGKGLVYALILVAVITWLKADDSPAETSPITQTQ